MTEEHGGERASSGRSSNHGDSNPDQLWGWPHDRWIAVSALVVAVGSLVVSVTEFRSAREHERLAAQPRLSVPFHFDDTGAGWRFVNDGLGPARLRGFRVRVDGERIAGLKDLGRRLEVFGPFRFSNPKVGDRFAAGHNGTFYWIEQDELVEQLRNEWTRVEIEMCYCSIFNECWLYSSRGETDAASGEHLRDDRCAPFHESSPGLRWWRG